VTTPVYVTLAQVKAYWPTNEVSVTTDFDALVTTLTTNCSRCWDTLTWRNPGDYAVVTPDTLWYDGVPFTATDYLDVLPIDEIAAVPTSIISDGYTLLSTDYFMWPYNAPHNFRPYTQIRLNPTGMLKLWTTKIHAISVTGLFGYSVVVPPDVSEALLLYIVRMVRKSQQNYLEVGTLLDSGQIMIGMKTDPDLQVLLEHYRKSRVQSPAGYLT
jgi:hypothetical protein